MGISDDTTGVDPGEAFLQKTSHLSSDPSARWQVFLEQFAGAGWEFESCLETWQRVFEDQPPGSNPCWIPSETDIAHSNIQAWCTELGLPDALSLHRWSTQNRQEFWDHALATLDIAFRQEPNSAFETLGGRAVPHLLPNAKLNIVESCFQTPRDQVALIMGDSHGDLHYHSYGELQSRVNQVSNALSELGLRVGDRIGVVMPMTFESIAIYLGIIQAGLVVVSIADSFASPEIRSRLEIANAKAVFSYETLSRSGKVFQLGERVRAATELPVYVVSAHHSGNSIADEKTTFSWRQIVERQSDQFEPVIGNPHDAINVLFSSGTTGAPKAIPWNQTTPIKCATDGHLHQDLHPGDVAAWPTNLGWMMGPWLIFATLINKGTLAVYDDAPFGEGFGQFIQDAQVNLLGVVPSMVRVWKSNKSLEKFDWSSIKCFSSTGEASNAQDMFYLSWLGGLKPIIEYCGGTEIGGGYISSTVVQPNCPATFSTAAFGLELEILDDQGQQADSGELYLVPPSIGLSVELLNRDHFETYFANCPTDQTGEPLRRHGDFFSRLSNGYFIAGGRTDDTMNLGGIKISSVEIEQVLNRLPEISESAAVAVPLDGSGPDQLIVFIVLSTPNQAECDSQTLLGKMNQLIRSELNPLFKIGKLITKDALPRTASNKVMRRLLRGELVE